MGDGGDWNGDWDGDGDWDGNWDGDGATTRPGDPPGGAGAAWLHVTRWRCHLRNGRGGLAGASLGGSPVLTGGTPGVLQPHRATGGVR